MQLKDHLLQGAFPLALKLGKVGDPFCELPFAFDLVMLVLPLIIYLLNWFPN